MKKKSFACLFVALLCSCMLVGCQSEGVSGKESVSVASSESSVATLEPTDNSLEKIEASTSTEPETTASAEPTSFETTEQSAKPSASPSVASSTEPSSTISTIATISESTFNFSAIPAYDGSSYVTVNNNVPYFKESDYTTTSYEYYSDLDNLGRCGVVYANIGQDLMPTEKRGDIGMIKPSGWHTIRYDDLIEGKYLYNRCHLIGYQLGGENANIRNLITGTRYLNVQGMLPFENMVADYVKETNNHVMYRVTPIFEGNNLLATGVLMEAYSVEDKGDGICYCVFAYNVQPNIEIDYATGDSTVAVVATPEPTPTPAPVESATVTYIGNRNTGKFHYPSCSSVRDMNESNKVFFYGDRSELINKGYDPCRRCNP